MRLLSHRVSGVVLNATSEAVTPPYHVQLLQDAGIPVVLLHRSIPEISAPVLEMPAQEIGRMAARLILDAGHQHTAFIESYRADVALRTEAGFRSVLETAGLELPAARVIYGDSSQWCGTIPNFEEYDRYLEELLRRLLSQPNRPTALYAGEDTIAEHLFLVAHRLGLRIPNDLSIVCFGGAHREGAILKRLTAITIDEVAAGKQAVALLQEMQSGRRKIKDGAIFRLPLALSAGDTLGPPSQ
jgi:LacI family transcriptional regulator